MALSLDSVSSIILKGEHLFANKLNQEFIDSEYNSNIDSKGFNFTLSSDLYYLISALQIRLDKSILDRVTSCLYLELERRLGAFIDPYNIDSNYLPPPGVIILPGDQYRTFLSLLDTPDSYNAVANYLVAVNPAQDALIFINPSSIGAVTSLDNGLHLDGIIGKLGGSLIESTLIDISTFELDITSNDTDGLFITSNAINIQSTNNAGDLAIVGVGKDFPLNVGMLFTPNSGGISSITIDESNRSILIKDTINSFGAYYDDDYSANGKQNDLWIPNWGAVHSLYVNGIDYIASGPGAGFVGLGGSLLRSTTIFSGDNYFSINGYNSESGYGADLTVFPGEMVTTTKVNYGGGGDFLSKLDLSGRTITLSMTKSRVDSGVKGISFNGGSTGSLSMVVTDSVSNSGLSYSGDYHTNNASNPRWIPDKDYIDNAIIAAAPAAYVFGTGSLVGLGTSPSPFYPNAGNGLTNSDVTNGIILGGTLNRDTTINTSTFNMIFSGQVGPVFNKTTGGSNGNIAVFQDNGAITSEIVKQGDFHGSGIANYPNGRPASFVNTSDIGVFISRDMADANPVLTVRGINAGGTAPISLFQNSTRGVFQINWDGQVSQTLQVPAVAGLGVGHIIGGSLRPTANSDSLIGLSVNPTFGTSTIATINTLVGGTGYTNGSYIATTTGGTGVDASISIVVSGGIVTSATLLNPGVNYTVADVLTIVGTGTGATVTVSSITSYTGVGSISAKFYNAPIVLDTITTPTTLVNGMIWQDGVHIYARIAGVTKQLD